MMEVCQGGQPHAHSVPFSNSNNTSAVGGSHILLKEGGVLQFHFLAPLKDYAVGLHECFGLVLEVVT